MQGKFYITQTESADDLPLPKYMTAGAAGMDVCANIGDDVIIRPGDYALIPTGVRIALPDGYEAQARPRSGLALKYGVTVLNSPGTIDSDYRGEVCVLLINHGKDEFVVKRGERIAQLVISKVEKINWEIVGSLDETDRGEGGYGSTDI